MGYIDGFTKKIKTGPRTDDVRTIVFDGLLDKSVRYRMQESLEASVLFLPNTLDVLVSVARATLLERPTTFLVLSTPVVELVCRSESPRRSDGEVVDA